MPDGFPHLENGLSLPLPALNCNGFHALPSPCFQGAIDMVNVIGVSFVPQHFPGWVPLAHWRTCVVSPCDVVDYAGQVDYRAVLSFVCAFIRADQTDLSRLSQDDRYSIEMACSNEKLDLGPAYNSGLRGRNGGI
jgi:hypothetical protein